MRKTMRVLFLNPPARERIMRRWTASYYAPNFLMPPLELMGLASIVREWKGGEAIVVDAIAEELDLDQVRLRTCGFAPDLIVIAIGFSSFPEDVETANVLAEDHPHVPVCAMGYLPSSHPREVLENSKIRLVFLDEPELAFSEVCDRLAAGVSLEGTSSVAFRDADRIVVSSERPRIDDLDRLPFPDHSLVDLSLYGEPMRPGPMGVMYSSRGCPYACTFCTRTFGKTVRYRSPRNILDEVRLLALGHGVKALRFMDDTLPLDRGRLLEICRLLVRERLDVTWTALSRIDILDAELLEAMVASGCRRLYVGVESLSQQVLDGIRKGYRSGEMEEQVRRIKRAGVELSGFFIVGTPWESDEDVDRSIDAAIDWGLDYVIVTRLQYWPGTQLSVGDGRGPSLFPFRIDTAPAERLEAQKRFYRRFYLRPGYVARRVQRLAENPRDALIGLKSLLGYVTSRPVHDLI